MDFRTLKILVVDDARVARQILIRALKDLGCNHFVEASNGGEGYEQFTNNPVDLVLSDWNMPGESGLELLKKVRAHPTRGKTPFIMVTAERMDMNMIQAIEHGVSNYVIKPYGAGTLEEKIRKVFP